MRIRIEPQGLELPSSLGMTIAETFDRHGIPLPDLSLTQCIAEMLLIKGQVEQTGLIRSNGVLNPFKAKPLKDCDLHWQPDPMHFILPQVFECAVEHCKKISTDVFALTLCMNNVSNARFHAGQFLHLLDASIPCWRSYSIASAPHDLPRLELIIQAQEMHLSRMVKNIQREQCATIQMPFGKAHLALMPDTPMLLIATGTGIAQMQSLIENFRYRGFPHPVHLYWSMRSSENFYLLNHWNDWLSTPNLHLHQVIIDGDDGIKGHRQGCLAEIIAKDLSPGLNNYHVIASGSTERIYSVLTSLIAQGMNKSRIQADLFNYAPRLDFLNAP